VFLLFYNVNCVICTPKLSTKMHLTVGLRRDETGKFTGVVMEEGGFVEGKEEDREGKWRGTDGGRFNSHCEIMCMLNA